MIITAYGTGLVENTVRTLEASDIKNYLKPGQRVAVKPNLVLSSPASEGATTHPEIVEGIILFLKAYGVGEICIMESSWVGDSTRRAFKVCGYEALSKKHGVPLFDLKADSCTSAAYGGLRMEICSAALNADFLINVPVLKAHCQTRLTCCMKNLKGCIPDREKRRFHSLGIHRPVAVLSKLLRTGYNVVDGVCGDLTFEEGGNPVESNRIIAGRDALELDSYCAGLIGYRPEEIEYLMMGAELGVGKLFSPETELIELNPEHKPRHVKGSERLAERYKKNIREDSRFKPTSASNSFTRSFLRCASYISWIIMPSAMISPTVMRGLSDAYGSWNMICAFFA